MCSLGRRMTLVFPWDGCRGVRSSWPVPGHCPEAALTLACTLATTWGLCVLSSLENQGLPWALVRMLTQT